MSTGWSVAGNGSIRLARRFRGLPSLRAVVVGAAVIAAVAAFLMFGPVGLGNGPLSVPNGAGGGYTWTEQTVQPAVYVVSLTNSSGTAAQIDSITVVSAARYHGLRVLSVRTGRFVRHDCTTLGPVSSLTGCVQPSVISAAGFSVPARADTIVGQLHSPALVIELAGPPPAQCSVIAAIVLHYHVGIRHYAATVPQGTVAVCGKLARVPTS